MIRHLSGTVLDAGLTTIVIDVHGVGYVVATAIPGNSFPLGSEVSLWTHLAVRETALDLYGFPTHDELDLFELLLTIPKIGPKSAIQIMTQSDIATIKEAVYQQDASYLTKVSGIGKKTAEKIVTELKDKFDVDAGAAVASGGAAGGSQPTFTADAIDALMSLGYPQADARRAVQSLPPDVTDVSDAVRCALSQLNQA